MAVRRVHLYVNNDKPEALALRGEIAARLAEFGMEERGGRDADAVIALGGDGTMLRAVREFHGVPVLGINLGGLGYLSTVEKKDCWTALDLLSGGRFKISTRTMLSVRKNGAAFVALNDIVAMRELSGHAALLDLAVDSSLAARYMADGLVVATPTGSTAYSLASGGPVLMPDTAGIVVTPMNPHALGVRPMVVSDAVRLTVTSRPRANGRAETIGVYADGEKVFGLEGDESMEIARARHGAELVELDGYNPYEALSRKLGWRGANAVVAE